MLHIAQNNRLKSKIITIFSFLFFIINGFAHSQGNGDTNSLDYNEEIRAEYGNWLQICEKEKNQCVGVQFALNVDGKRAARFIIERIIGDSNSIADSLITLFVPYESNVPILPNGITLIVDNEEPFKEQFLFCDQLGCTSQFGLTKQGIDLFLSGANLSMFMVDVRNPNNKFIVDIDLENFDKIYESLNLQ